MRTHVRTHVRTHSTHTVRTHNTHDKRYARLDARASISFLLSLILNNYYFARVGWAGSAVSVVHLNLQISEMLKIFQSVDDAAIQYVSKAE